ncbi:CG43325 [Drosophila busckii]|uniref:CG43325 n=1 Tax=Drosophila busckii TaxID=30019 RepID=A0A0M4E785_DROBS|nr:uncharacterized protein LOC108595783 [Drosophila busckii]ALC42504.1 CG43325 [Drosophila busckii]
MSRSLKFSLPPEQCAADLVEINLNTVGYGQTKQQSAHALDELLAPQSQLPLHRGYPYGYTDAESDAELYFCKKSNSTGELAEKVAAPTAPAAANISCLRQMYCPACHERLHEQGVRLERLLTLCCFALLPVYPCCMRRSNDDCKVICGKCGYSLGAWKRQ